MKWVSAICVPRMPLQVSVIDIDISSASLSAHTNVHRACALRSLEPCMPMLILSKMYPTGVRGSFEIEHCCDAEGTFVCM